MKTTVLLPIYCKTEASIQYLKECLDSLIHQDCKFIAFDDASPLQTEVLKLVNGYKPILEKLVLSDINRGPSHARNVCAELVETELLLPLDCDDTFVEGAVNKLENAYVGVPIYPDIAKFGLETVTWYVIPEFSCDNVLNYVGFTSVNVLHSKHQWKSLGGWDQNIEFYEDGEYNARLLGTFCGKRYPEPLVNYRIHGDQRTKTYGNQVEYGKRLLHQIRSYGMACKTCGQKRRTASNVPGSGTSKSVVGTSVPSAVSIGSNVLNLPLEFEGKVLSQYMGGKGAGKHYYRGHVTSFPYRVQYGDFIYADPKDVVDSLEPNHKLVRVQPIDKVQPIQPAGPIPKIEKVVQPPPPAPEPVVEVQESVIMDTHPVKVVSLPDINTMSVKDVLALDESPDFTCNQAEALLTAEKRGLNRSKVVGYLEKRVCGD